MLNLWAFQWLSRAHKIKRTHTHTHKQNESEKRTHSQPKSYVLCVYILVTFFTSYALSRSHSPSPPSPRFSLFIVIQFAVGRSFFHHWHPARSTGFSLQHYYIYMYIFFFLDAITSFSKVCKYVNTKQSAPRTYSQFLWHHTYCTHTQRRRHTST